MPAVALPRVGAPVVESGPNGENLAAGAWQRLEALPDPRALARALLGGRPDSRRGRAGPSPGSVRGYPARHLAGQAKTLARGRLRAVAVDGKTARGARRADGTRVHLLGAAEHGGHLLDHLELDTKHNETSHFTALLEPLDLAGAVVTFDALCRTRHKASYADLVVMPTGAGPGWWWPGSGS